MNPPIYFVTGALGFVGRHLCRRLIKDGIAVHALVRRPDPILAGMGVQLWIGDLWDENLLQSAMAGATVVVHCAGDAAFGNGPHYHRANVELTHHVLHAAKRCGEALQRFIYVSTIGAVDRSGQDDCRQPLTEESTASPVSDYGKSKLAAEKVVAESGLPYAIVRPTMVVGDDMRYESHFAVFARHALADSPLAWVAWPGSFSVVHVDDLVAAIQVLASHQAATGKVFFCAGEALSVHDFLDLCRPRPFRIGLSWVVAALRPFMAWIPFSLKAMLFPTLVASDARLRELGWKPLHTPASALAEVIARERSRLDPNASAGGQTVITGAASGLGRALACRLAGSRERLLLIDRDAAGLAELVAAYPNSVARVVDLAQEADIDALLASPEWQGHAITELYACAGIGLKGRMQDIPTDGHLRTFRINVLARIALARAAISGMQRRHYGRVVMISSSSAFQPLPYMATYAATNSALLSLGEAWAEEVAQEGVHVMTVCPGGMQTNFQRTAGVRELEGERLMTPEEVADRIISGLEKRRTTLIVSFRSFAMSMLARLLPRKTSVRLWFRLMEKMR
jgi:short-subunit dehydrogenase/thioester reductase-like protein